MPTLPRHIERLLPAMREAYPPISEHPFEWLDNGELIAIRAADAQHHAMMWIVGCADQWAALNREAVLAGLKGETERSSSLVALRIADGRLTRDQAVQTFMAAGFGFTWWPFEHVDQTELDAAD